MKVRQGVCGNNGCGALSPAHGFICSHSCDDSSGRVSWNCKKQQMTKIESQVPVACWHDRFSRCDMNLVYVDGYIDPTFVMRIKLMMLSFWFHLMIEINRMPWWCCWIKILMVDGQNKFWKWKWKWKCPDDDLAIALSLLGINNGKGWYESLFLILR